MKNKKSINMKKNKKANLIFLLCVFFVVLIVCIFEICRIPMFNLIYKNYKSPIPILSIGWQNVETENLLEGDIYVSKSGSDSNSGTKNNPFLSIERALQEVATLNKTNRSEIIVCIESGVYNIESINFQDKHGGTENCRVVYGAYGNGDVVLNSGIQLSSEDFVSVSNYSSIADR